MKQIIGIISIIVCTQIAAFAQHFTKKERAIILYGDTSAHLPILPLHSAAGHAALRNVSTDIAYNDSILPILLHRMYKTVTHPDHDGVGIAAPQVGINRKVIWVQRFDKKGQPFEYFINPLIIWQSDLLQAGAEGDLSFDDRRDDIFRSYAVTIQYQNLSGLTITESMEGFTAVIMQHEIDHLYGVLLLDRHAAQSNQPIDSTNVKFYLRP